MRRRLILSALVPLALAAFVAAGQAGEPAGGHDGRSASRSEAPAGGYIPPIARDVPGRYIVQMRAAAPAAAAKRSVSASASKAALASQTGAIAAARNDGGSILFRYDTLLNGFSARLSPSAASALSERSDIARVEPVTIVRRTNETSVPFIGADRVHRRFGASGQGQHVAVIDDGIDYTHKNLGGAGTVEAYQDNNPNFIERGTFPTKKVIGGYDFVGSGYDPTDDDPTNDTPHPDADPFDDGGGHGSHTAGTCCGIGVPGKVGAGVAPKAKIVSYKVWAEAGASTDDVLVAAFERAMDPNQDGRTNDHADVISFSGGVDYGSLGSADSVAAQRAVRLGTVVAVSAGNAGNQGVGGSAYVTGSPANARGVISVAATIDEYATNTITADGVELPSQGIAVEQDFGGEIPPGGLTDPLFDGRDLDPPASPGSESPADAQFCTPLPPGSLAGTIALAFKGSTSSGDCAGSAKVYNAQLAGADGVILISLFGGYPSGLSSNGEPITIPALMVTADDGYAILDALSPAPPAYNANAVNGTLEADQTVFGEFADSLTDFTSEGPAGLTSDLKPDISAPGYDIRSTAAGTGDGGIKFSGTSMAAPHIAGVAALLRQIHPTWGPGRIKALIMNQATRNVANNDLSKPAPATAMGAGRVRADGSAKAVSIAQPASLSFGLDQLRGPNTETWSVRIRNTDRIAHRYRVDGGVRFSDYDPDVAKITIAVGGGTFGATRSLSVGKHGSKRIHVRLHLKPALITEADQLDGWYAYNPGIDGTVHVRQLGRKPDRLDVAWHALPLAASANALSESSLDLTGGTQTMELTSAAAAGTDYGDLYLLGATDPLGNHGEADIVAAGARTFAGASVEDATPEGLPTGSDEFAGITWLEFVTSDDEPTETIEFGIQSATIHNTQETLEADVLIDTGDDGVFSGADDGIDADYVIAHSPPGGAFCVYDLSLPEPFDDCAETYFLDYSSYNTNLIGLPVDGAAIGLTDANPRLGYQVVECTDAFSGDTANPICDTAGGQDPNTGRYDAKLDAVSPSLDIDPLVCRGFWSGGDCDGGSPISVTQGSAGAGDDPSILALFPNDEPSPTPTIVTTTTGP